MQYFPRTLKQTGLAVTVQLVEIMGDYILIRMRGTDFQAGRHEGIQTPVVMNEIFTLQDANNTKFKWFQNGSGGGPFRGQVDVAFDRGSSDISGPLTLSSPNVYVEFSIIDQ
jgi:hypothetical protein